MVLLQRRWRLSCSRPVVRGHGEDGTPLANLGVVRAHERNRFSHRSWIFWFGRACATLHCVGSSEVSRMHRLSFQCVVCRFCASIAHPTGELRHQDASAIRSTKNHSRRTHGSLLKDDTRKSRREHGPCANMTSLIRDTEKINLTHAQSDTQNRVRTIVSPLCPMFVSPPCPMF